MTFKLGISPTSVGLRLIKQKEILGPCWLSPESKGSLGILVR